ncbi:MAG TPA: hypothetical protein PKB09_00675 [Candidatus Saccharibacteria bacterium]|nr:hypothetical protein [Candidatus Saccharibacteria bacterium]
MYKVDLHTHSTASPDGGISIDQYIQIIGNGLLDFVAITDHNTTKNARALRASLGEKIIVGEEITCLEGEIIGLFLSETIKPGLRAEQAAKQIKKQGGLVYVPHPFETVRKGLPKIILDSIAEYIDIVEVYNGRALMQNKGPEASVWARVNQKATAASSDAHGEKGLGTAYSLTQAEPKLNNLIQQLSFGHMKMSRPPLITLLYPKANRLRQKFDKRKITSR